MSRPFLLSGALLLAAACLSGCATSPDLSALERTLATQDSATTALGEWCRARHIADPPAIRAQLIAGENAPASAAIREQLDVDGNQSVAYRHVRLSCGERVLSVAHNWYVPSRLSPQMNQALETSDSPFGKVAAPLRFTRERLASRRGAADGCPRDTVLSHKALLRLPNGHPLSLVVECYTRANLQP